MNGIEQTVKTVEELQQARVDGLMDAVGLTTKSRNYLNLPRVIDPKSVGEATWFEVVKSLGPIYYFNNKFFVMTISRSESNKQYRLTTCGIGEGDIKRVVGKDIAPMLMQFIAVHRKFDAPPILFPKQYVYESGGELRWGLSPDKWQSDIFTPSTTIDFATGEVNLFLPFEAPQEEHNDDMDKLISIVVGNKVDTVTYKNWLAQMCFENRTEVGGRASLILYGKRGSGKGFLIECLTYALIPYMASPVPSDFQSYNEYLKNKLVYLDEQEQDALDLRKVYIFAKRLSGGKIDMVGGKYKDKIKTVTSAYFACMSNGKPLHMQEIPTTDRDNQWIVFKFDRVLNEDADFTQFKEKYGENLMPFIRASVGRYLLDVLHPIYLNQILNRKNYRYGFPIPITDATRELFAMAETTNDVGIFNMLEELETLSRLDFQMMTERLRVPPFIMYHYDKYQEDGFVSNKIIEIYRQRGLSDLTPTKIQEIIKRAQIAPTTKKATMIRINGVPSRGYYIDRDKYREVQEQKLADAQMDEEISFEPEQL